MQRSSSAGGDGIFKSMKDGEFDSIWHILYTYIGRLMKFPFMVPMSPKARRKVNMIPDLHTVERTALFSTLMYRMSTEAGTGTLYNHLPSLCFHESLCVNPSVAHTTKQWSPKQSADMSPGTPAPPQPLAPMGVYIPSHTSSFQTVQWKPATHSSPVWVGAYYLL